VSASRRVPKVGQNAEIGDTVAIGCEPGERYARIVGFLKQYEGIGPFLIRTFQHGDGWYPTGEYRRTSQVGITPIIGPEPDEVKLTTPGCMERAR
jgi:hypothetical protein